MSLGDVVDKLRKKILGFRDRKELIVEENTKGAIRGRVGNRARSWKRKSRNNSLRCAKLLMAIYRLRCGCGVDILTFIRTSWARRLMMHAPGMMKPQWLALSACLLRTRWSTVNTSMTRMRSERCSANSVRP